jgi:hypothetical protein
MSVPLNLRWDVMFCDKHLLPLKKEWPSHAAHAMLGIFTAAVENEEIMKRAKGKQENLALVFNSIKPVCCFLPDGVAEKVVEMALQNKVYGKDGR